MKYLGLHKILWLLLVLLWLSVEIMFVGIVYILYAVWNLRWLKVNIWYNLHNRRSELNGQWIKDRNPWQTLVRRYNFIHETVEE